MLVLRGRTSAGARSDAVARGGGVTVAAAERYPGVGLMMPTSGHDMCCHRMLFLYFFLYVPASEKSRRASSQLVSGASSVDTARCLVPN